MYRLGNLWFIYIPMPFVSWKHWNVPIDSTVGYSNCFTITGNSNRTICLKKCLFELRLLHSIVIYIPSHITPLVLTLTNIVVLDIVSYSGCVLHEVVYSVKCFGFRLIVLGMHNSYHGYSDYFYSQLWHAKHGSLFPQT